MKNIKHLSTFFFRHKSLRLCKNSILSFYEITVKCFKTGGFLYIIGNGGSASDCDHFAGEMLKGFMLTRGLTGKKTKTMLNDKNIFEGLQKALPVIPLTNFNAFNTAFSNDCNSQYIFAQLVWALVKRKDTLLCISTSGNSKNILNAAKVAKAKGVKVVSLTNYKGGLLKSLGDLCINVPELETFKTQELHLPIYHIVSILLEHAFFGEKVVA